MRPRERDLSRYAKEFPSPGFEARTSPQSTRSPKSRRNFFDNLDATKACDAVSSSKTTSSGRT